MKNFDRRNSDIIQVTMVRGTTRRINDFDEIRRSGGSPGFGNTFTGYRASIITGGNYFGHVEVSGFLFDAILSSANAITVDSQLTVAATAFSLVS